MQIEGMHPGRFLRIHRNCLVARASITGVRRAGEHEGDVHWEILLHGLDETLPVSRRQWPQVRQVLAI